MYLYLRRQARAGLLEEATVEDVKPLLRMPGAPGKPHYLPFVTRGIKRRPLPTFWRGENLAGMWSQTSIYRQDPARWLSDGTNYVMPDDSVELARMRLLDGVPISAIAFGAYFLRNFGFAIDGDPTVDDLVMGVRRAFDFPDDSDSEFASLFAVEIPSTEFSWFERVPAQTYVEDLESNEEFRA